MFNITSVILQYLHIDKQKLNRLVKSLLINTKVAIVLQGGVGEVEVLEKLGAVVIENKSNLGYAGGHNVGIRYALGRGAEYVLILNPDIDLHKNCVEEMLKTFKNNHNIGIVGPKILDQDGKIWALGGKLDKKRYTAGLIGYGQKDSNNNRIIEPDFVSGTAMLVKKEVFEKIGLFREDYFLYYEDVDFCLRAKKAGFRLAINPKAKITHYASSTVGKNSPFMQYYMARNHLMLVERFGPLSVQIRELLRLPKTLYDARLKKYELLGIRDYFLRRFGKNDNWG